MSHIYEAMRHGICSSVLEIQPIFVEPLELVLSKFTIRKATESNVETSFLRGKRERKEQKGMEERKEKKTEEEKKEHKEKGVRERKEKEEEKIVSNSLAGRTKRYGDALKNILWKFPSDSIEIPAFLTTWIV